jgi:hypothetical protein
MDVTIRNSGAEGSIDSRLNNAGMTNAEGRGVIPEVCSQESRGGGAGGFPSLLSQGHAYDYTRLLEAGKVRE